MRQPMFALLLSAALAGCVGDGGTNEPDDGDDKADDPGDGDGSDGDGDGAGEEPVRPEACPSGEMGAVASLSDVEAYNDPLEEAEDGPRVRYLWGGIDTASGFEIDLYDGYGAFKSARAAPGSFTIGGEDADPELCGLCLYMWIDTEEWSYFLQADAGSVTLEEVDGRLKGSASSVTFKEIGDEGTYMEGGCTATIDSVPFDAAYGTAEDEPPA
jgi:hypothetical protein